MTSTEASPTTRRFVAINPDDQTLSVQQEPAPTPGPGEVLIKVHAAGINRADLMQRAGLYPPPADASPIMGLEVSGEVIAVGDDAGDWQVGNRICALTHGGGYADVTIAPVSQCFPVPKAYSMDEAAALPEAVLTVWHNLFQRCQLQAGEKVLIHGGASGIGTLAIALCKAIGAEVYTTAGSPEKCRALEELGAARAINYKTEDFEEVLTELGLRDGINVILDMAGGDFVQKNLNVAAPEGRIVYIAFIRGFQAELNMVPLLMKRLTVTGSTLRAQSFAQKAVMVEEILERVYPYLDAGSVRPIIDSSFPLEQVAEAQAKMQGGSHMGKIILTMKE
ncbi:MAG: NAD(P)H-quinone oxidoreductase [Halieaceae bacterium]